MKMLSTIFILCGTFSAILAQTCPNGQPIYSWGISDQGKNDVVDAHNYYRGLIASGSVPNQPKGRDLLPMSFDEYLSDQARQVSAKCILEHLIASDDRFWWVGQNLFLQWSSEYNEDQDWSAAVTSWFNENKDYIYPTGPKNPEDVVGHYTQVVWADSYALGCDFIMYYDSSMPDFPYAKLYTCNYGPGGNVGGQAPYPEA